MSSSSKNKKGLWYGYLEAGNSSSPVIRDENLETGNAKTIYLFNLARGKIIEYQREIVESKLRDLKPAETTVINDLDTAYREARRQFTGRVKRTLDIPEHSTPAAKTKELDNEEELEVLTDDDDDWVDSDED